MNNMVWLTVELTSHDTDASANSVKWLRTNKVAGLLQVSWVSCDHQKGMFHHY